MNLHYIMGEYLGWCPSASSASSFKQDSEPPVKTVFLIASVGIFVMLLLWGADLFSVYSGTPPLETVKLELGKALPVDGTEGYLVYGGKQYYNYPVEDFALYIVTVTSQATQNVMREIVFISPGQVFSVGGQRYLVIDYDAKEVTLGIVN